MQYLIVLSALLSLATAVMAQSADTAMDEGDEVLAMGTVGHAGKVSAPVAEQDLADDFIE
jgi:hypothetical protein